MLPLRTLELIIGEPAKVLYRVTANKIKKTFFEEKKRILLKESLVTASIAC